jgi:hypothetical protein
VAAVLVVSGLYYLGTLRCGNSKAGFISAGLMCSLALVSITLRPQMLGYVFLIALLIVLELFRQGVGWLLWSLPPLFLVWVNVHGSFVVGLIVVTVFLCCGSKTFELGSVKAVAWSPKQRLQLESVLLLSVAVLPITPYGTKVAAYPLDIIFRQPLNTANIQEWGPMPFDEAGGKLFLCIVVVLLALQVLFRYTWRMDEALLAFGGAAAACLHLRMLMLFVPFSAPIFATMMAKWVPAYEKRKERYWLNGLLIAVIIAAIAHYIPSRDFLEKRVSTKFPVSAVKYLDGHPVQEPMLNNYSFGGYLLATGRKVFIDGRADLFERSNVLADMITLAQIKPGALRVLDRYAIGSCLLQKGEPLSAVLSASPDWERIYEDETATIFVRKHRTGSESN